MAADLDRAIVGCPFEPVSEELTLGLKCRLCGKLYPKEALNFCTDDFGPLEVVYDYDAIGRVLDRETIQSRPRNMWRYRELAADRRRADRRPPTSAERR